MFDLNLISLTDAGNQEPASLPGLFATAPQKHPARGRAGDQLVMLISPLEATNRQNEAPFATRKLDEVLNLLSKTYYLIPGTVTTALRSVVEVLNQNLLDTNLHQSGDGRQSLVLLNLAAIHANQVYLAHCGPTHTFVVSPRNVDHFNDQQLAGRGLGLSRAVSIRFYQAALDAGSSIIFCPEPPPAWSSALLQASVSLPTDAMRRRLAEQGHPGLSAAIVQCSEGSGKITSQGKPFQIISPAQTNTHRPESQPAQGVIADMQNRPGQVFSVGSPVASKPVVSQAVPQTRPASGQTPSSLRRHSLAELTKPVKIEPVLPQDEPVIQQIKHNPGKPFPWKKIAPYWAGLRNAERRMGQFFQAAITRLLPGSADKNAGPSPVVLVFIAIAVPILIAAVGLAVYLQKGRNDQFVYYYAQAQAIAQDATNQADPQTAHNDWQSAMILLGKAEGYKVTGDSTTLRSTIQSALDQFDSVIRLTFQPALVGSLPKTADIGRMVTNGNDLYLLDKSQGAVYRAFLTGRGYEIDPAFLCGPGQVGNQTISPLVEIASLPINNPVKAAIIAIDSAGNLLYCQPGSPPTANYSGLTPPGDHWGTITAFAIDNNQIYVLDPQANIGIYSTNQDGTYDNQAGLFFDTLPSFLNDAVDLTVNAQDLYLLHADGHMTLCTFSPVGVEATRCTNPAPYSDPRAGHEPSPVTFLGTKFSQIEYTSPPDPSIFLLDPDTASIYHFSLRMNLQRLLRPQPLAGFSLPGGAATAFYISPNRMVFMAFRDQVLLSYLP